MWSRATGLVRLCRPCASFSLLPVTAPSRRTSSPPSQGAPHYSTHPYITAPRTAVLTRRVTHSRLHATTRSAHNSATNVVRSDYWVDNLPVKDVATAMFEQFAKWPQLTAIECDDTGRSYTFGDIPDCSLRIAAAIQAQVGDKKPKCVSILSPNVPEYPLVVFGTLAIGASLNTVASLLTPAEIASQLLAAEADAVVVDPALEDNLLEALKLLGDYPPPAVLVNGPSESGALNLLDIVRDLSYPMAERVEIAPDSTAILLFSSGTTGKPKGVCTPHKALSQYLPCYVHPEFFPMKDSIATDQDVSIGLIPFYHTFGLYAICMSTLYRGAKLVCMSSFDPFQFVSLIGKHKVEMLHLVPPLLNFLAHSPMVTPEQLTSVRHILIGSAPVHPAVAKAFKAKTHPSLHFQEALGLTEMMAIMLTPMSEERIGCCGKLLPNHEARVVDISTGENLGPETSGELWIRGPGMMSRYHNNPEATKESIDPEGWFKTGDLVTYTTDGFFKVVDRIKELVKVKGMQVSPTELEELILQVEGVAEAGVVGIPDDRAGELPRAYVVLKDDVSADGQEAVKAAITKHMADKAAPYKQLAAGIVFADELPKNPTGKLLRRKLKERAMEDISA